MNNLTKYLQGGDLRSISDVEQVVEMVNSQSEFDQLFGYLYSTDRLIVMRAADAIEKITFTNSKYLEGHKVELIKFLQLAPNKEFKWHLALLISRLSLEENELQQVWEKLTEWVRNEKESKIVKVNALQALHDLSKRYKGHEKAFDLIVQ